MRQAQRRRITPQHKGISRLLSVIFAITFAIFLILYLMSRTVLNVNFTKSVLNEGNDPELIAKEVRSQVTQSLGNSGIPSDIVSELIDTPTVTKISNQTITNVYAGKDSPIPTQLIINTAKTKLNTITNQLGPLGISVDGIIAKLNGQIKDYLDSHIQNQATQISQRLAHYRSLVKIGMVIAAVASILLALGLLLLFNNIASWWYLFWGVFGAAVLALIATFILKSYSPTSMLSQLGTTGEKIIGNLWTAMISHFWSTNLAMLGVGIVGLIITGLLKFRKRLN